LNDLNQVEETSPAEFFASFQSCRFQKSTQREKKEEFMKKLRKSETSRAFIVAVAVLISVAVLPKTHAVTPPPDGGYPNFTTAEGLNALKNLTTGAGNTGVGWYSLFSDTAASFNTGVGAGTLALNTGDNNTAVGTAALLLNTTGFNNTGIGSTALLHNNGGNNTGAGAGALASNTTGNANTAIGVGALAGNIDGGGNTATGVLALNASQHGVSNTANGFTALQNNTASNNTAMGAGALHLSVAGGNNTAVGFNALGSEVSGISNVAIGSGALANATHGFNIAVGADAGINVTTAVGVTAIGHLGANVDGGCFIGRIRGVTTNIADAIPVVIDSFGQLGTISSSNRFKKDIKPMEGTSGSVLDLKPVTFHYKNDKSNIPQFGLIAEEVAKIDPDLVARDKDGEIYTVRYDAVNAMLLNEFLKEHCKVGKLEAAVAELAATVKEQAAELRKVNGHANDSAVALVQSNR
jgi:trimeric autotransporter adhesin